MILPVKRRRRGNRLTDKRYPNFKGGLNTLVSPVKIKDNELSVAQNIKLVEEGVVTKRDGQAYYGNDTSLSTISGLINYYKSDGTTSIIVAGGTKYKKYNTVTSNYDDIASSPTITAGLDTAIVQAYDKLFFNNGTDAFCSWDGTNWTTYSALSTPSAPTLAKVGAHTSGLTTYSYRVSAFNAAGETLASTAATVTNCLSTLSTTNAITVTISTVVGATGYAIYGRVNGQESLLVTVDSTTTVWTDDGTKTPSIAFYPPEENNTAGKKGSMMSFINGRLIISGDPNNPSRVYWSGGGSTNIANFGANVGGGYVDISKSDGEKVTGLVAFQDNIFIFKTNSVWKMTFTGSEYPTLSLITRAVGCIAPKTICVVENDIFFLSYKGVYVIGNEPNYVGVIRTNELSAKIRDKIQSVNKSRIDDAVAYYYDNKYVLCVSDGGSTYNNIAYVYDRERLAWFGPWTEMNIRSTCVFTDTDGTRYLLTGQDSGGRIIKQFSGNDDFGTEISFIVAFKQDDMEKPELLKTYQHRFLNLRDSTGSLTIKLIKDGETESARYITTLSLSSGGNNYAFGTLMFGQNWSSTTAASNKRVRMMDRFKCNAEMVQIEKSDAGDISILDYGFKVKPMSPNTFPSTERLTRYST